MPEKGFSPKRLEEAMAGMSKIELSEKLGCAKSSISMYLSGQRVPSKMAIQLMAICLGVNPAWLMGLDVPKYLENPALSKEGGLTDAENALVKLFRLVPDENKDLVLHMIEAALKNI